MNRSDFHALRPDYQRPPFTVGADCRSKMLAKLTEIYGSSAGKRTITELERLMAVYHAHKTAAMLDWEREFRPENRFTEKDAVLITYGDLIRDEQMKPLAALSELCEGHLKGVFNSLHILPFFPYSSDRGFAVINFLAVDPNLGTWEDILRLKGSFKLMFDGVFNHISSRSRWFQEFLNRNPEFSNFFISYSEGSWISKEKLRKLFRPRTSSVFTSFQTLRGKRKVWTTFGEDQVDLNFANPAVLLKIVEILLYYIRRGTDLLRLDAVTYLWKELGTDGVHHRYTHLIIQLLRDVLDEVAPHVAIVTETNVPHEQNISYFGNGRNEAQMVYNFALPPLLLHTFSAADSSRLSDWAKTLGDIPSGGVFFNFLDSHDGIGVMGGRGIMSDEEIGALVRRTEECGGLVSYRTESDGSESPYELNITSFSMLSPAGRGESQELRVARYLAARSIPIAIAGVPGVYLHGLIGSENDTETVKHTDIKRDINRRNLNKEELFSLLRDPSTIASMVARGVRLMLEARQANAAFHPLAAMEVVDAGSSFFCMWRGEAPNKILTSVNVTDRRQKLVLPVPAGMKQFRDLLSGDVVSVANGSIEVEMDAYRVAWWKPLM